MARVMILLLRPMYRFKILHLGQLLFQERTITMSTGLRTLNGNIAMSSFFGQYSQTSTTQVQGMMVGEKAKSVTLQGPYNAQQSGAATGDVVSVGADYGVWDYTVNQSLDPNSTNLKDPV